MSDYTARQRSGTEYGGVAETRASLQPKPAEALTNAEKLRLGYLTGVEHDTESLEDHRQFCGLRPASGARPLWLSNASSRGAAALDSEAHRQGFDSEEGHPITSDPDMPVDRG